MTRIREIQIPGTNITMVDGDGDGQFMPKIACYQLKYDDCYRCPGSKEIHRTYGYVRDNNGEKVVNTKKADHYLVDSKPACPNDWNVIKALRNAGFANVITSLDVSNLEFSDGSPNIEENWACLSGKMSDLKSMFEMNAKLKDPDQKVRYDAAAALVGLTDKVSACTLFAIVERELIESPYAEIRYWAAQSLGQPGRCEFIRSLSEALKSERSTEVRNAIVWALGRIQNSAALGILSDVLKKDPSPEVRKMAISAITLFRANDISTKEKSLRKENFTCLEPEEGLWDEIYHNHGVDSLLYALRHDPDEVVRMDAAEKLGIFCSTKVTDGLIQTLLDEDEDDFVRVQSALSLGLNADLPVVRGALLTAFFENSGDDYSPLLGFDPLSDAIELVLNRHRWWL